MNESQRNTNMEAKPLTDLHTHILPGVDDGAPNLDSALMMLRRAKDLNIGTIVATPHLRRARDIEALRASFVQFRPHAEAAGIRLLLGFELHYRMLEDLSKIRECTIEGTNLVLMELPESALMPNWESILIDLVDADLQPVIAHPERYRYIQNDIDYAAQIRSFGCDMQVDAQALNGLPLTAERRCAQKLFREGYCDYIASDAHKPEDYTYLEKAFAKYKARWPARSLEPIAPRRPTGAG
jgi:protein-tyrosine phosphatase